MKKLIGLTITLTDGQEVEFTPEDDIEDYKLIEGNAVIVVDVNDNILAVYNPLAWTTIEPIYDDEK